jgi:hypothetical protein
MSVNENRFTGILTPFNVTIVGIDHCDRSEINESREQQLGFKTIESKLSQKMKIMERMIRGKNKKSAPESKFPRNCFISF